MIVIPPIPNIPIDIPDVYPRPPAEPVDPDDDKPGPVCPIGPPERDLDAIGSIWIFKETYIRIVTQKVSIQGTVYNLSKREIMGYGAENAIINQDNWILEKREPDDSAFRARVLKLTSVPVMNPWACVERVPRSWSSIDIAIYHVIEEDFDLVDAKLRIIVAPQSSGLRMIHHKKDENPWKCVREINFFKAEDTDEWEDEEFGKVRRDEFATVHVPESIRQCGDYCVKVELVTPSDTNRFSRGYSWEGIGITQHAAPETIV